MRILLWGIVLALTGVPSGLRAESAAGGDHSMFVYIGTYTGAKSQGIYFSRFDSASGELSQPELTVAVKNPSFLALHPQRRFLYAVGEINDFGTSLPGVSKSRGIPPTGAVSAFAIGEGDGKLALLNQQASGGGGPCHLSVDHTGSCVLVANYGSGSIAALPIQEDGRLGTATSTIQHSGSSVNHDRQAGPHAHYIAPDPANKFALACDLGLDKVLVYHLDAAKGLLTANAPPSLGIKPGSGPRHLAFHPGGKFVYLINEMGWTLSTLQYDAQRGALTELEMLPTLPEGFSGANSSAEVQVHPSGKFVYASNRGDNSIALFSVNAETGKLTFVERQTTQGKTPRYFGIDPSGRWLLVGNQDSDSVVVFHIDAKTGRLSHSGHTITVGSPVCLLFVAQK